MPLAIKLYNTFGRSPLVPNRARRMMLRAAGATISDRSRINPDVSVRTGELTLGAHSTVNQACIFDNRSGVVIGDRVGVGIGAVFTTSDHERDNPRVRSGVGILKPIRVGDGASVGSRAVILRGVTIGEGAVVAAGAIVTMDIPPHQLWGGVPARHLKDLPV